VLVAQMKNRSMGLSVSTGVGQSGAASLVPRFLGSVVEIGGHLGKAMVFKHTLDLRRCDTGD
jgi:hypothetical protein